MKMVQKVQTLGFLLALIAGGVGAIPAHAQPPPKRELMELDLEDLMNVEVSSVSRRSQSLRSSPAAVFVLNADDIRRSSARSIPELLRLVPGLNVTQLDGNRWAISARGFNDVFSDKLLVLFDGRVLYNHVFSGVLWDVQQYPLEDIERIEVIRGPGATLWGANAVNGVINIISRPSSERDRFGVTAGGGVHEEGFGNLRGAAPVGEIGTVSGYAMYASRDNNENFDGSDGYDGAEIRQGGFRADLPSGSGVTTIQGDLYNDHINDSTIFPTLDPPSFSRLVEEPAAARGGNLLARTTRRFDDGSEIAVQFLFDRLEREMNIGDFLIDTYDTDAQYRFQTGSAHEITIGLNYRHTSDDLRGREILSLNPERRSLDTVGGFLQDEIQLSDVVRLTLGSKYDHHEFVGSEFQPSVRVAWDLSAAQTVWASVSRAVRIPSRANNSTMLLLDVTPDPRTGLPVASTLVGNRELDPEEVWAYELGHRVEVSPRLSFDTALFYNHYDRLSTVSPQTPEVRWGGSGPFVYLPMLQTEGGNGDTFGGEVVVNAQITPGWRIQGWYALLQMATWTDPGVGDPVFSWKRTQSPQNSALLRSLFDLSERWRLDGTLRYVDAVSGVEVGSYWELDARLAWLFSDDLELSLNGINLLHDTHRESRSTSLSTPDTYLRRAVYGKLTWRF